MAAANLAAISFMIHVVSTSQADWWTLAKLLILTLVLVVAARHQWRAVVHCAGHPGLRRAFVHPLSLTVVTLLAGLVFLVFIPVQGVVGGVEIPFLVSLGISIPILVFGPVILVDVAANIEGQWLAPTEFEEQLTRSTPPANPILLQTWQLEINTSQLTNALRHTWADPRNAARATHLKYDLVLAFQSEVRPQVVRYSQLLIALYDKDSRR